MNMAGFLIFAGVVLFIAIVVNAVLQASRRQKGNPWQLPPQKPTDLSEDQLKPAQWGTTPTPTTPRPTPRSREPQRQTLDLTPGHFAPQSPDQTRAAAQSLGNFWASAWFGRRDLIPPASDPRTILIDRALVGRISQRGTRRGGEHDRRRGRLL